MRYLIEADTHWSQYSSILRKRGSKYSVRLEKLIESANWVEQFAVEQNCDGIIHLGDHFDKPHLNAEEITALQDVKFNDLPHTFLVGNHESGNNSLEYSSTAIFKSFKCEIINKIKVVNVNDKVNFYYLPYMTTDMLVPFEQFIDPKKKAVVFAHADIAGLQYGRFTSTSGYSVNDIKKYCDLFINGHLHTECVIDDRIVMVGNLTGANFNEDAANHDHLVYILEVNEDKISLESYVNPVAMNFYRIKIDRESDLAQLSKLKTNAILSVVCLSSLRDKALIEIAKNKNVLEYRLTVFYDSLSSSNVDSEGYNFKIDDHITQFINLAYQKFENTPILVDELTRLQGGE